ncbi:hypothetical protein HMN09_00242000 [Mycena chlorophos]|uniref:von Willebrand domain-containing protein n=1 Tax=Mycena chlorophos TaxID=658473 RepID=A0A8H6TJU8_MYCCL|nr:hypothetical protein HMN09_00242000 [Mycena chlorophos]
MSPYGLCFIQTIATTHHLTALPLLKVGVDATIKELAAQVKLAQSFKNNNSIPIEATYRFPVPARAAVCNFAFTRSDGTRVNGVVREKQEARATYEKAVVDGKQASLLEQHTPDVFQVSVGNILPYEQVDVELIYATELTEDEENDSVRFRISVQLGTRYGQVPYTLSQNNPFFTPSSRPSLLRFNLSVEAVAPISKIGSPSHTISTELGPDPKLPNYKDLPFAQYARVSLTSDAPLKDDFVLAIKSAGLDAPRCVAERAGGSVALALSLVPRFTLPDPPSQEFILLVDRSGSMEGARIAAARKALVIMLRALPHKNNTSFNIASFGSYTNSLWPTSRGYNQETLEEATRHVDGMHANFGGTEIQNALKNCFSARRMDRQTSVLVLTDGDAWNVDGVLDEVKRAVAKSTKDAPLRVSVLGIGESVSTAMCEGIARVGNGACMLVGPEEGSFTGKIARLLKASRTPSVVDVSVDWGVPMEKLEDDFELVEEKVEDRLKTKLNIFDVDAEDPTLLDQALPPPPPPVALPPPPAVQQSPFKIANLVPGTRLTVYAILQGTTVPETVILRGSTASGHEIELRVPVTCSHLPTNSDSNASAIHALAARKLIQNLEDGSHALSDAIDDPDLLKRTVNASIARLETTYSIASSQTSFVAVDEHVVSPPAPVPAMDVVAQPVVLLHQMTAHAPGLAAAREAARASVQPRMRHPPPPARTSARSDVFEHLAALRPLAPAAPPPPPSRDSPVRKSALRIAKDYGRTARASASSLLDLAAVPSQATSRSDLDELLGLETALDLISSPVSSVTPKAPPPPPPPARRRAPPPPPPARAVPTSAPAPPTPAMYVDTVDDWEAVDARDSDDDSRVQRQNIAHKFFGTAGGMTTLASTNPSVADPLEALARMQSFDGCFPAIDEVLRIVKLQPQHDLASIRALLPSGAGDSVAATLLVMAFMATKLAAKQEEWEGMHEKAREYVVDALGAVGFVGTVDAIQNEVEKRLA